MAAAKKTVKPVAVATPATAPKAEDKKVETPAAAVKTEVKVEKPVVAKKETVKKEAVKKEAVKKEVVKKEAVKKAPAKKAELKSEIQLQFAGKSYTQEDLVKIAKDVWKYDLNKDENDFKTVELYVKPEESAVYYVINDDVKGSFGI